MIKNNKIVTLCGNISRAIAYATNSVKKENCRERKEE